MSSDRDQKTIFIGGLPDTVTEPNLHEHFSPFGDIVEINVPREGGTHRGFGFITFSTAREVEDAIDNMHLNVLHGRVMTVNVARPMKTAKGGRGPVWQDEEWIKQHALPQDAPTDTAQPQLVSESR